MCWSPGFHNGGREQSAAQEMPGEEAAVATATTQTPVKRGEGQPMIIRRTATSEYFVADFVTIIFFG